MIRRPYTEDPAAWDRASRTMTDHVNYAYAGASYTATRVPYKAIAIAMVLVLAAAVIAGAL